MENELNTMAVHPDYQTEIVQMLRGDMTPVRMRERLLDYHANDIAATLCELDASERKKLYRVLDTDMLADVLDYATDAVQYFSELSIRRRVDLLSRVEITLAVSYMETLEKQDRSSLLELLEDETKREIVLLTSFDKDEIGSKMSTNYISIPRGIDVRGAMHELIRQAAENDNVSIIYVVDEEDRFVGALDLKDLIRARSEHPLEDIVMTSYPYVYSYELIEDCLERLRGYSEDSFPVLDAENRLCGVLTAQELTELIEDEIVEDYAMLGGLSAEEDLHEPLLRSLAKRLPWLAILFGLGMLVSSVVGMFDEVIARLSIIVSFQSLILGMAGNVGTQSLAVTIRALADETLDRRQKLFLIFKEARVGLCNGLVLGVLSFVLIGLYLAFLKGEALPFAFSVSLCIGAALLFSMLLSGISGTSIPILFKKLGLDPAVASGPFITTLNDLVAVLTYYGFAYLLLIRILLY